MLISALPDFRHKEEPNPQDSLSSSPQHGALCMSMVSVVHYHSSSLNPESSRQGANNNNGGGLINSTLTKCAVGQRANCLGVYPDMSPVMRTQGSLRLILNTKLWPRMQVDKASEKSVRITAMDTEDQGVKVFLISVSCPFILFFSLIPHSLGSCQTTRHVAEGSVTVRVVTFRGALRT